MRIVGDGEGCPRFEETCEAIAAAEPDARLRAHASECAECAGALRAAEALRRTRSVFDAPEPDAVYWAGFSDRLDARIRAPEIPASGRTAASKRWALVLGIAASAALVAGALMVRQIIVDRWAPPPAEAELLQRLGEEPEDRVAEYLDEIAPPELGDAPEDLAVADGLFQEEGAGPSDEDNPYDLFQDLGDEDRALLLKEMRGEIG